MSLDPFNDTAIIAGLLALAVGLTEILKLTIKWISKRTSKDAAAKRDSDLVVRLDPEVSRLLQETSENVRDMHGIMGRVDQDGTPMVYSSRSGIEHMREMAMILGDVAKTQERLAASLDKLDEKFTEHAKEDQVVANQIVDRLEQLSEK